MSEVRVCPFIKAECMKENCVFSYLATHSPDEEGIRVCAFRIIASSLNDINSVMREAAKAQCIKQAKTVPAKNKVVKKAKKK